MAGGKGGVGKSIFSVALATILAQEGNRVAVVDLDLGAANVHTYFGIIKKTPTIADFILKKVPSLENVLIDTSQENLKVISGAEFVPGMANPAHWIKLKIMRHVKALPADLVIIDLGAGVHFNTLDFFGMSDRGIVVTAPEPGAVMNAYGFIKGALFRKLQNIFRKHPDIGPIIEGETKKTGSDTTLTLDSLTSHIEKAAPDMLPVIREVKKDFCPALVVNRIPEMQTHVLVKNLISLCREKLGISIDHIGNLPDSPEIGDYLLRVPEFLSTRSGKSYLKSVQHIIEKLLKQGWSAGEDAVTKSDFTDEEVEAIIAFMESLDDSVFGSTGRNALKLKMYFKPAEVVQYLITRGVTHEAFYR